jgi:hypothetical protein
MPPQQGSQQSGGEVSAASAPQGQVSAPACTGGPNLGGEATSPILASSSTTLPAGAARSLVRRLEIPVAVKPPVVRRTQAQTALLKAAWAALGKTTQRGCARPLTLALVSELEGKGVVDPRVRTFPRVVG